LIPIESESYYQEDILRMPDGWLCYEPPKLAPEIAPLPSLSNGYVTFGSFNNLAKLNSRVLDTWAEILRRSQNSRLLMKARGLGGQSVDQQYLDAFSARGVDPNRLEFSPSSSHTGYLESYRRADVLLDPFPFSGGTTTCDALWMGVPVITRPGETYASRHSLSHLSNVGLTETIVRNADDYVELAVELANDLPRLARLREGLRERMAASPLCDGKRFATNLMNLLRDVWKRQCANIRP
jgi:predicted O-linked N-acetylglucosamine transferase (SPINDLY family)